MSEPIISVSGLRGIVGESLTPQVAIRYACAFAGALEDGPIVVTRDGRTTGRMLAGAVLSGLCAVGRAVIDADVAATPTTGVLVRQHGAAGGIQITASHNPLPYNGLKLFSSDGRVLTAAAGEQVTKRYREGKRIAWVGHDRIGGVVECTDTMSKHAALVLATVNAERIRSKRFRVFLDSNHASSALLGRHLLDELGCHVTHVGAEPNGCFSHPPEPTEENLAEVCGQVRAAGASVGFCTDPDGDRLAVVDETGRYVGEEYTLAMCVDHVLRQRKGPGATPTKTVHASQNDTIVTNCSTSRMSQDLAERYGVPFVRSAVGEANVVDAMLQHDAVFGGEGNGGPIDPRVGLVRDSFVGMAQLLDAMALRQMKISQLADELPRYEIVKTKIPIEREKLAGALDALEAHFAEAKADRLDGLRLDWPGAWLLVRPSNTEPIVRAVAEAQTESEARRLCDQAANVLSRA